MNNKKRLMIIGAGILQVPAIETAREMGLTTIVTDYNSEAMGLKIADYPIIMSTKDIEGSVRVAKAFNERMKIDGVFTVGTDASMTVAAVAAALGLPGITYETAELATNKYKMRQRLSEAGVPCPQFGRAWNYDDAVEVFKELSPPVVVKPTMNMGARGVVRVDRIEDLKNSFQNAKSNSPVGEVIIEEYMEGDELSIDALVYNGDIHITGVADRIIEYPPYFVETGHIMPSNLPQNVQDNAIEIMKKGIRALGITIGAAKGDIKITSDGAKVGEIAARLSGGFMSAFTYPYSSGVNLIRNGILIALGERPQDIVPKTSLTSVEKAIIPKPGIVKSISGIDNAMKINGVKNIFLNVKEADYVKVPTNNVEKAGNVIVVSETREESLKIAEKALETIEIETDGKGILTYEEVKSNAIKRFNKACFVCRICDGKECKGQVPGMGGIANGKTFANNLRALDKYRILTSFLHDVREPKLETVLFGKKLSSPLLIAPMAGTETNMGGALSEHDYTLSIINGAKKSGIVAMLGDGTTMNKHIMRMQLIRDCGGGSIPIFKPRTNQDEIIRQIIKAEEAGSLAVGLDIDALGLMTFEDKLKLSPKSVGQISELVRSTSLPFVLKGVMSKADALRAVDAGVKAVVVSNHGGRVMDDMPGTADVLAEIVEEVRKDVVVMVDGGFRTGADILKGLALGAQFVLLGRPVIIGAVGGGEDGVALIINKFREELKHALVSTGTPSVASVPSTVVSNRFTVK